MSLYASIQRLASDWAEAHRAARTAHLISSLPADLRKDIGWPARTRPDRPLASSRMWAAWS